MYIDDSDLGTTTLALSIKNLVHEEEKEEKNFDWSAGKSGLYRATVRNTNTFLAA